MKPEYERAKKGGSANEARSCPTDSKFQDTLKGVNDTMDTFESESKDFNGGNSKIFETVKQNITGWLEQDYSFWNGFELNYRNIEPKILIEPLMTKITNQNSEEIQWYCFNGNPEFAIRINEKTNKLSLYDENLNITEDIFSAGDKKANIPVDNFLKQSVLLSKELSKDYCFVRVDLMVCQNKIYFEELTFTPYSGFHKYINPKYSIKMSNLLKI